MPATRRQHHHLTIDTSLASPTNSRRGNPHSLPQVSSNPSSSDPDYTRTLRRRWSTASSETDETFPNTLTPVYVDMADRPSSIVRLRDSHDLSLSPRNVTRDSFVTNMLLSLDQFSYGQAPSGYDLNSFNNSNNPLQSLNNTSSWANIVGETTTRGHNHQFSYASEIDGTEDIGRTSEQTSRGRRSTGNSNNLPSLNRLDSVRENGKQINNNNNNNNSNNNNNTHHIRGGKGSKSSSVTSIETPYASRFGGQSRSHGATPPSVNYDQASRAPTRQPAPPPMLPPPINPPSPRDGWYDGSDPMSPFQVDFDTSFSPDDFDAAPTPTVHGGPRRIPSTPVMTQKAAPEPLNSRTLEQRKRSTSSRSLKTSATRKAAAAREEIPAVPVFAPFDADSAPSPNVSYGKPKEPNHVASPAANTALPPKEKQGFFRKFFGGSSKASNDALDPPINYRIPIASSDAAERASSSRGDSQTTLAKSGSLASSREIPPSHSQNNPPPTLQKKTSSFFRRRRKSIHDEHAPPEDAPPLPPLNLALHMDREDLALTPSSAAKPNSGVAQKLKKSHGVPSTPTKQGRQAGDTASATPETSDTNDDTREYKREFSPDYEPSSNAHIRTVQSTAESEHTNKHGKSSQRPPLQTSERTITRSDSFLDLDLGSDDDHLQINHKRRSATKGKKMAEDGEDKDATIRAKKRTIPRIDLNDDKTQTKLTIPNEGSKSAYQSGNPTFNVEAAAGANTKGLGPLSSTKSKTLDEPEFVVGEPTQDDRSKAQRIYDGNEDFIQQEKAASWMGEEGPVRQRTLQAYMELYDFTGCSIVQSLRQVCGRLVFRAETQQVDRILVAFSKRWVDCNPNHGFKATDVIHTICYSIMLLNTDLHLADIESKMTRSQFVKNTISTVTQAVQDAAPDAFDRRPSNPSEKSPGFGPDGIKPSQEQDKRSFRNSFKPPPRADSNGTEQLHDCGPLVKAPYNGSMKMWEELVESVLKNIYSSIRDERLPLFGAEADRNLSQAPSQSSLSVGGLLKRSPSVLSKAPSENHLSSRGRINDARQTASRWSSKSRSRPGAGRNGFSSSHTSFDDGGSVWSPALSSANWSRQSLGRTQTSASQDSFGSGMPRGDYQQSIGFANALSQAIIRDEDANGNETAPSILSAEIPANQLLEDESLELSGPPWVKEGMVIHKHHLDGVDKKAKERNWSEVFAVIQKGQMSLFSFTASKSQRQKNRSRDPYRANAPVGGGNWQDNATTVGSFSLRQTLASALPPPGYSRTRPHVWALSLPTGAVHLFQVGTPELIKEFVNTVNYWSARLSTHPLIGGVSNMEYGWSDAIVNNALVTAINEPPTTRSHRPSSSLGRRSSITSATFRGSSLDQGLGSLTGASSRGRLPADRMHIAEWSPPTQSMRQSSATESKQLTVLAAYVKGIEEELQAHNQLRSPMLLAFTPRGANATKAMSNWERKSAYLLREIVKFRTYVDCLQAADSRKRDVYAERDLAQRAARGELSEGDMDVTDDEDEADETLRP